MAHIVVLGAGLGGMSAAYELRDALGKAHRITVIGDGERFAFTPVQSLDGGGLAQAGTDPPCRRASTWPSAASASSRRPAQRIDPVARRRDDRRRRARRLRLPA